MTNNMTIAKKNSINKILVVGHEQSEYKSVLKLLNAGGMSLANPSVRDGMQADEISKTILKNFKNNSFKVEQLNVSPVWNGLALDLMMANIEEPMWCWTDPDSVLLLNYWKALDSQLAFIFVYENPKEFMLKAFTGTEPLSAEALKTKLNEWCWYNKALLSFYYHNKQTSLLVNSHQVSEDARGYLQHVVNQTGIPLLTDVVINTGHAIDKFSSQEESLDRISYKYLADELLEQFPQVMELYEELESVASLPPVETFPLKTSAYDAWNSLLNARKHNQQTLNKKKAELEKVEQEKKKLDEKVGASEREKRDLLEENELLLAQLHIVQEELEIQYLKNTKTENEKQRLYGAADRVKAHLSYRLGAAMIENGKSPIGLLKMPFVLLKEVKTFRRERSKKEGQKLPPIDKYCDAYEAEKVKKHLSYRLGQAMINNKTPLGWLKLPFALKRAHAEYRIGLNS